MSLGAGSRLGPYEIVGALGAGGKLRPDGTVKVLDFGLAKPLEPAAVPSPNGKRFIAVVPAGQTEPMVIAQQINIVFNWFEELKARVPTK